MNLVTGGTGLLGSHIVEQLCQDGRPVRVLVRQSSDTSWLGTMPVEIVCGDVTDLASIDKAMEGVERVYDSAAQLLRDSVGRAYGMPYKSVVPRQSSRRGNPDGANSRFANIKNSV